MKSTRSITSAVENRTALRAACAEMIRDELGTERLTDQRRKKISAEIQLVAARDATLAAGLNKVADHFRDWHADWELDTTVRKRANAIRGNTGHGEPRRTHLSYRKLNVPIARDFAKGG